MTKYPLTEAQKAEKAACEAERVRKIQRTANRNSERARVEVDRRRVAGTEGLVAEASRKSTRRKSYPLTVEEKAEKARADADRRRDGMLLVPNFVLLKQSGGQLVARLIR